MVDHLLWILAIYGAAVALVHWMHARRKVSGSCRRRPDVHYVLVTSNHERQVEWYLRALSLYALLNGTRVRVTVLDDRSEDQTKLIAQKLCHLSGIETTILDHGSSPEMVRDLNEKKGRVQDGSYFYIDLRIPMEAARIPYVH